MNKDKSVLTLNLCDCARQDVFLHLLVLKVSHNFGNHTLGELKLFALFLLLLITNPTVENSFHLGSKSDFLFLDECICLQLRGLLLTKRISK